MLFRPSRLGLAASLALTGATLATPAVAQGTQRIEITGSAIKRIDAETPAPIEIAQPADYEHELREHGYVIADFAQRRDRVRDQVDEFAKVESSPRLEGRQMVMVLAPR